MVGHAPLMRRPLVLTGGPAVGKSTCARALATAAPRAALVDVDDVRQLVVSGAAAPWEGSEGERQRLLGAHNACALANNFVAAGFEVVIADVLTPATAAEYRRQLPGCLVVRLVTTLEHARLRAATRRVFLTEEEFDWVHEQDFRDPPEADVLLQVDGWTQQRQVHELLSVWHQSRPTKPMKPGTAG